MNQYRIYTANSTANTVSVCHMDKVAATIPVGKYPRCIALTPDESKAFVTNYKSNTVSVIDTAKNKVIHTITEIASPTGIAIGTTVHGLRAYVGALGLGVVYVIDPATYQFVKRILVGSWPAWAAITTDGAFVYVSNFNANTVSVVDTALDAVVKTIPSCFHPLEVAASRSRQVYVVPQCMNLNFAWIVEVIDELQQQKAADVELDGVILLAVAAHPEGTTMYVTEFTAGVSYVVAIDTATHAVSAPLKVGTWPKGAAVSRDGAFCFVSDFTDNKVVAVDTVNFTVFSEIQLGLGNGPFGIAVKTLP